MDALKPLDDAGQVAFEVDAEREKERNHNDAGGTTIRQRIDGLGQRRLRAIEERSLDQIVTASPRDNSCQFANTLIGFFNR